MHSEKLLVISIYKMENKNLQELYNLMDFYATEEPTLEREQKLKEIAHEIVMILTPNKNKNGSTVTDIWRWEED